MKQWIGAGGAVLYDGDANEIGAMAIFLSGPHITSNICEYEGLLLALRMARTLKATEVEVYGDSELVVRQVSGQYQARKLHLRALRDRCWQEAAAFESFIIRECPRGKKGRRRDNNARADALCARAMDLRQDISERAAVA